MEKDLQRRLLRDKHFGVKGGMLLKFVPDLSKIPKAQRIEEMVLMHVWLSGIKALPDTNSFLARVFNLNRDKVTISTDSRYVL
jgi:hypothetical protein